MPKVRGPSSKVKSRLSAVVRLWQVLLLAVVLLFSHHSVAAEKPDFAALLDILLDAGRTREDRAQALDQVRNSHRPLPYRKLVACSPFLRELITDGTEAQRQIAVFFLNDYGVPSDLPTVKSVLALALASGDYQTRHSLFTALKKTGPSVTPLVLDALVAARGREPVKVANAVSLLGVLEDPRAVKPLLEVFQDPASPEKAQIEALSSLVALKAVDPSELVSLTRDRATPVRAKAFKLASLVRDDRISQDLLAVLTDPTQDTMARAAAGDALRGIVPHPPRSGSFVEQIMPLLEEEDDQVGLVALSLLGLTGDPVAADAIVSVFEDSGRKEEVRLRAAYALAGLEGAGSESLLAALGKEDTVAWKGAVEGLFCLAQGWAITFREREIAALAGAGKGGENAYLLEWVWQFLAQQKDPKTIPPLIHLLEGTDPKAKERALSALKRITGVDKGESPSSWEAWYAAWKETCQESLDPVSCPAPSEAQGIPRQLALGGRTLILQAALGRDEMPGMNSPGGNPWFTTLKIDGQGVDGLLVSGVWFVRDGVVWHRPIRPNLTMTYSRGDEWSGMAMAPRWLFDGVPFLRGTTGPDPMAIDVIIHLRDPRTGEKGFLKAAKVTTGTSC